MIRPDRLGPALARVRLHRVEFRTGPDGSPLVAKRRHWWASIAISPGNLYLRWLGAGVEVLGERSWHHREQAIHQALYGIDCPTDRRGWLLLPRWPGLTLAAFVADRSRPATDRLAGLAAAGAALRRLHQVQIDGSSPLSHGDATLRNVQFDPATGRAAWFDFDTAHRAEVSTDARHADDLRAFLWSAVAEAADIRVLDLVETIRLAYVEPAPWWFFRSRLRSGEIHFSTFHLAQAGPTLERQAELNAILRRF